MSRSERLLHPLQVLRRYRRPVLDCFHHVRVGDIRFHQRRMNIPPEQIIGQRERNKALAHADLAATDEIDGVSRVQP